MQTLTSTRESHLRDTAPAAIPHKYTHTAQWAVGFVIAVVAAAVLVVATAVVRRDSTSSSHATVQSTTAAERALSPARPAVRSTTAAERRLQAPPPVVRSTNAAEFQTPTVAPVTSANAAEQRNLDASRTSATGDPGVIASSGAAAKAYVDSVIALPAQQQAAIYGNVTASQQHLKDTVADWARAEELTGLSPASLKPIAAPDFAIADWARAEGLTGLSPASLHQVDKP